MNLEKYFSFYGRATRSEYWAVQLISLPVFFGLMIVAVGFGALGTSGLMASAAFIFLSLIGVSWLVLGTTARRCRDAGINPWFTLAVFVPYLAIIPWIVFGCLETKRELTDGNT